MYDKRLLRIRKYGLPPSLVEDFDRWLAVKNPIQTQKISPVDFASETSYEVKESFKAFHYASLESIFETLFEVICPSCLKRIAMTRNIQELSPVYECQICSKKFTSDQVLNSSKVWFSLTPCEEDSFAIREIHTIEFTDGTEWKL